MNVIEKFERFKTRLEDVNGKTTLAELRKSLNRIKHCKEQLARNQPVNLDADDLKLYRFMVNNDYSASTVYQWLLVYEAPAELRDMYLNRNISYREFMHLKSEKVNPGSINAQAFLNELNWTYECFYTDKGEAS